MKDGGGRRKDFGEEIGTILPPLKRLVGLVGWSLDEAATTYLTASFCH